MSPRYGRRRLGVALVAVGVLAVAVWLLVLLTTSATGPRGRATLPSDPHPLRPASGSVGGPVRQPPLRNLAVAMTELPLVDTGRNVVSGGVVLAPDRSLPTYVWTPVRSGRFPLVVFAPGYDVGPLLFQRFCATLASSGYVVAAPSFPLEDPSRGYGLDRADLPDEAGDVSFVISSLERHAPAYRLQPSVMAVVGHSDGADVALEVGYEQGTVDPRVLAVVAVAPDPITGPVESTGTPLLLVQGTADSIVPYSSSQTVFAQLPGPTYYESLIGADHLPPIAGGTPWTPVLDGSVADFLDAVLARRGPGPSVLSAQLGASPLVRLATKG